MGVPAGFVPVDAVHEWVTQHGCPWGPRVERHYDEERTVLGACFSNALQLMIRDRDLRYCEGYALYADDPASMHHGWCVTAAGEVVDPTWPIGKQYFGVMFGREYATRRLYRMRTNGTVGSLIDPWDSDGNYRLAKGQISRKTWER